MSKRRAVPIHGRSESVQAIVGTLERMHHRYGPWEVFRKFLDLCHLCSDELPDNCDRAAAGEAMVATEAYQKLTDGLHEQDIAAFAKCFGILINATTGDDGELTYADVIGSAYMTIGHGNKWSGQYFTPQEVADCMAMMLGHDADIEGEFYRRLAAASEADPILKCLGLTAAFAAGCEHMKDSGQNWALTRFLPLAMQRIKPFTVMDPCVGSGVMLLSAAKACPRWLIDIGFVRFYGMDIDHTCVSMCRLNMRLYGIEKMRLPQSLIKLYDSAAEKSLVPPPQDELYEAVRVARESGDAESEQKALSLVAQARQGTFAFEEVA